MQTNNAPATVPVSIPSGTVVYRVSNGRDGIRYDLVVLQGDAMVEATRQNDGCWGYTIGRQAYVCAGGCAFPVAA